MLTRYLAVSSLAIISSDIKIRGSGYKLRDNLNVHSLKDTPALQSVATQYFPCRNDDQELFSSTADI